MRRTLTIAILLLAGCAGPSNPPADVPDAPAQQPIYTGNVTLDPTAAGNGTVGGITVSARGAAGSWLVVFHPFPNGTNEIRAEYRYDVATQGAAGAVFWSAPFVVWGQPDEWSLRMSPFLREVLAAPDGPYGAAGSGGLGAGGSAGIAGVFAAFAADVPWSVSFDFVWGEGDVVTPAYVRAGDGATFGFGGDQTVPVPGGAGAGISTYSPELPAGWNHLEVAQARLQPDEVRSYDFRLPGGHAAAGIGTLRGHYVPFVGGSASSGGMVDYIGALDDKEGQASMEMQYASAALDVRFGHMNIPLQDAPPGMAPAQYTGDLWPFPEPIYLPDGVRHEGPDAWVHHTSSSLGS